MEGPCLSIMLWNLLRPMTMVPVSLVTIAEPTQPDAILRNFTTTIPLQAHSTGNYPGRYTHHGWKRE